MSIFSKLFGKKDGGRVSGVERYETDISRPLVFRTKHGGSKPLGFRTDIVEMKDMKEIPIECLKKAIEAGVIDETFDLENSVFANLLHEMYGKGENELYKQKIERKNVADIIREQAFEDYAIEQRRINMLYGERKQLTDVLDYEKTSDEEKGLGDLYE